MWFKQSNNAYIDIQQYASVYVVYLENIFFGRIDYITCKFITVNMNKMKISYQQLFSSNYLLSIDMPTFIKQ